MMPLEDGRTHFAASLISPRRRKIIRFFLVFASLAILAPVVMARQRDCGPGDFNLYSISSSQYSPPCRSHTFCEPDLARFSDDNLVGAALDSNSHDAGSPAFLALGDAIACAREQISGSGQSSASEQAHESTADPKNRASEKRLSPSKPSDFNRDIYYRNKLEFAFDVGWLPINIPFPFDVFEGDPYDLYPLRYTLVPILASLRWQVDDVGSPWILRGNWDVTATVSVTAIPRGAETHFFSYDMGVRRNFVQRNWRVVPYVDIRAGLGLIDAKGPLGVYYAQGQNFTFTMNMGSGVRYNFNPRYAISAGLNWMHISNNNLSAPQYSNYGINVYGPMFGIDIQLGRNRGRSAQ